MIARLLLVILLLLPTLSAQSTTDDRYPKIVAVFGWTGTRAALESATDSTITSMLTEARQVARVEDAVTARRKIVDRGDGKWELYIKVVRDRRFEDADDTGLVTYRTNVRAALLADLTLAGATGIEIIGFTDIPTERR